MITITCSAVVSSCNQLKSNEMPDDFYGKMFIALINHAKQQNNKKRKNFLKKQKKPFLRNPRKNLKNLNCLFRRKKKSAGDNLLRFLFWLFFRFTLIEMLSAKRDVTFICTNHHLFSVSDDSTFCVNSCVAACAFSTPANSLDFLNLVSPCKQPFAALKQVLLKISAQAITDNREFQGHPQDG